VADRRIGGKGGGSDPGPGKSGKGGGFVVAAALVAAVALAGGGVGTGSLGRSPSGGGSDPAAGRSIGVRKVEAQKAARTGNADEAWRRMGMRRLRREAKRDLRCVASSFGQVRGFLVRHPCRSLERVLFAIGDDRGNVVVVSVAWVGFRTRRDAREFQRLEDVHGTGDITPLAGALLDLADIRFTGRHYRSRPAGSTTVVAETEPATGRVGDEMLGALADVAVLLPHP
jgi:hypothetical protein